MSHHCLEVQALTKAKDGVPGISFIVPAQQITSIIGINGAGKTTLLRMILTLTPKASGTVLYKGSILQKIPPGEFGYMPENDLWPKELTPRELLSTHLRLTTSETCSAIKLKCEQALEQVGLGKQQKLGSQKLSKGEKRKLAWLLATIHKPAFIILDEPFSGLDVLAQEAMSQWLITERQRGATLLLCDHSLERLLALSQSLYILKQGTLNPVSLPVSLDDLSATLAG